MLRQLDLFTREYLAIGILPAALFVVALGAAGALIGIGFPAWNGTALLETPGVALPPEPRERDRERGADADAPTKMQHVTLAEFRKVQAAYSSESALREFLTATKDDGTAARTLLQRSRGGGFWESAAAPVLPFSRRDAREFGELKDAAANALVGIDLTVTSDDPALATAMLATLSSYYTSAIIRERVRSWVLKNTAETSARQQAVRADVIEARMKIDTMGRRIQDLKAILARYPEAGKLDARQVVSITEGADRFLSPLAQLVAAETSITQLKETIARKERQALQSDLQHRYFEEAGRRLQSTPLAADLVPQLVTLAGSKFEGIDPGAEWAREVVYRIQADVAGFSSALSSFGIRNEVRVTPAPSRDAKRLALFGMAAAVLLLGLVAFVRASLNASARSAPRPPERAA
jgi:hypothetical protein